MLPIHANSSKSRTDLQMYNKQVNLKAQLLIYEEMLTIHKHDKELLRTFGTPEVECCYAVMLLHTTIKQLPIFQCLSTISCNIFAVLVS